MRPARLDDLLDVSCWISERKRASFRFAYEIRNEAEEVVATGDDPARLLGPGHQQDDRGAGHGCRPSCRWSTPRGTAGPRRCIISLSGRMIEVQALTKHYGPVTAIRDVSFSVAPGTIVGFLGPNGAGKSTTMRILSCFMPASSGTARVAGYDVFRESLEVRKRIGYLPGERPPLHRHAGGALSRLRGRGEGRPPGAAPGAGWPR